MNSMLNILNKFYHQISDYVFIQNYERRHYFFQISQHFPYFSMFHQSHYKFQVLNFKTQIIQLIIMLQFWYHYLVDNLN